MTAAAKPRKWTVDEFLAWHELQEEKYELVDGVPVLKRLPVPVTLPGGTAPVMMTGATLRHNKINSNLSRLIGNQLSGGPCNVFANDAAVETGPNQIRYPDLVVDCNTKLDSGYILKQPKLVIEILSGSTRTFDLTGKITEYWRLDSLAHVMIVDTQLLRVQLHTRLPGLTLTLQTFAEGDQAFDIPEIGVTLKLADIFEGLAPVSEQ